MINKLIIITFVTPPHPSLPLVFHKYTHPFSDILLQRLLISYGLSLERDLSTVGRSCIVSPALASFRSVVSHSSLFNHVHDYNLASTAAPIGGGRTTLSLSIFLSPSTPIFLTTSQAGRRATAQRPKFKYVPPTDAMIATLLTPYCLLSATNRVC